MNYINYLISLAKTAREKDPARKSLIQYMLYSPGVKALASHKRAHALYNKGYYFLAERISAKSRAKTGIEIHPGAQIGDNPFIDHGMGIVIGETAIIGSNVTIFHGATLGGIGGEPGVKRHPTIGDNVLIGAGAKLLGNINIGDGARIGANAVVLSDVPAFATAVGVPSRVISRKPKLVRQQDSNTKHAAEFNPELDYVI
ncbi:MAG: serine O-acetyltransferase [Clostridiaceae bacterium]